jgi:hypothetical protein
MKRRFLMCKHKRSQEAVKKRSAKRSLRRLILARAFHDPELSETVCLVSRVELMNLAGSEVQVSDVPDMERGEVLVDSRGQGSFQKR